MRHELQCITIAPLCISHVLTTPALPPAPFFVRRWRATSTLPPGAATSRGRCTSTTCEGAGFMFGYGFICLVIGLISIPACCGVGPSCAEQTQHMRSVSCLFRACRAVARLRPSLPLHPAARRMRARPLLLAPLNFAAILPLHVCPNLLCSSPFAGKAFDFSHTIHKLAFGREYPVRRHLLLLCSANACRADMH